jgi:hypothetical protein
MGTEQLRKVDSDCKARRFCYRHLDAVPKKRGRSYNEFHKDYLVVDCNILDNI